MKWLLWVCVSTVFYSAHSSCSPTRGSLMTGRHPKSVWYVPTWIFQSGLRKISIAQVLKAAGYNTAHFGEMAPGTCKKKNPPTSPGAMGFDEWLSHDNFF